MARNMWTPAGRQASWTQLLRQVATGRLSRRRFAQRALALGVSATAVASALRAGSTSAWQVATPEGFVPIGEELDLANLSPEIPEPTEPVTITFASWVNETPMMNDAAGPLPGAAPEHHGRVPGRAGRGDGRPAHDPDRRWQPAGLASSST